MKPSFHKHRAGDKLFLKLGHSPAHGSVEKAEELQNPESSERETEAVGYRERSEKYFRGWEGSHLPWALKD